MSKEYATIRLSNLQLVKQAKIRAAQDGNTLLGIIEKALAEYLIKD